MITFLRDKTAREIAKIHGGKLDKKKVYVSTKETNKKGDIPVDLKELLNELVDLGKQKQKQKMIEKINDSMDNGVIPDESIVLDFYNKAKKKAEEKSKKELILHEGEIIPIPNSKARECSYVCGPSGSGKSTYISKYAKEYKKIFPKKKIYVFSRLENDETIDLLHPVRVIIDDDLVNDPINPSELEDSLVIFDDTDTISDKNQYEAIRKLKEDLLETGRHNNIYVVISSHLMTNYKETRKILNECHNITFFPKAGNTQQINYCLKNYMGLNKKQIEEFLHLPSRWVTVYRHYPQYILYSKGIKLLSN